MIDRLRTWARNGHTPKALADDLKDAADEIERMRNADVQFAKYGPTGMEDIEAATIERCAQVAENFVGEWDSQKRAIAAAIRALKDNP